MNPIKLLEQFLHKLIDLAGNPHAKEELHAEVDKLANEAVDKAVETAGKDIPSGQ